MPHVFLTIDTEFRWGDHAAGLALPTISERSIEPAGVGLAWQLDLLARHRLKATFFVDPMPALVYGEAAIARVVAPILAAGQEVQLHLHPNWVGAHPGDGGATHGRFELIDHSRDAQAALLAKGIALLTAAGAPAPVAFRAGSYAANDDTLSALAMLGIRYDSSHNGAHAPWPSAIGLPAAQIAPVCRRGVMEVPVTLIEDRPGRYRNVQVCALSAAEMRATIDHAMDRGHEALTIVSHSFELANRAATAPNRVHVRRFEALCAMLAARRTVAPTAHFADHPALRPGRDDQPLPPSALRLRWRQVEQAWSTLVEERAA